MEFVKETALNGLQNGFQVCSHAIGDRANREILDRYEAAFKELPNASQDHRFRIEHAQHLHPDDIPRFAELGVIPAMQAVHMSSDRPSFGRTTDQGRSLHVAGLVEKWHSGRKRHGCPC